MDFDFLVFPSPKCSYNKEKLGDELIFIPKYNKTVMIEDKKPELPFYFSKQILTPSSQQFTSDFINGKKKTETTRLFTSKTTSSSSIFQSPRKINVKLEMTNYLSNLNKKDDDDHPITPILTSINHNEKSKEKSDNKKNLKKPLALQELAINEQKKTFFLQNKNDFDENVDIISSPKKILDYRFKEIQTNNPFKMNSPRCLTSKYKSKTHYFETPLIKNNQTVRIESKPKVDRLIPCLLLDPGTSTDKILIYFHGNAEDIYLAYELLYYIQKYLKVKVLAVEYPGYGLYTSHKPSSQLIQEDATAVYDYLVKKVGYDEKKILILGRSIGSGPASFLSSIRNPGALIMMSSFTSLKSVVKDHVGSLHNILKERFNNIENIKKVKCPCFFIHGLQDKLISYQHSQKLHDACKGPSELCLPKDMTHSEFCFDSDFIIPLENFLRNYGLEFNEDEDEISRKFKFPAEVYKNVKC